MNDQMIIQMRKIKITFNSFKTQLCIETTLAMSSTSHKHLINQPQLQKAWDVSQRSTASDWNAWFARFSIQLLIESPSAALRSCSIVAQSHLPLAKDLFQASFVSCWLELSEHYQEYLIKSLHVAFQSMTIPDEILLLLLNLAEFMEHDVDALPIEQHKWRGFA